MEQVRDLVLKDNVFAIRAPEFIVDKVPSIKLIGFLGLNHGLSYVLHSGKMRRGDTRRVKKMVEEWLDIKLDYRTLIDLGCERDISLRSEKLRKIMEDMK